MVRKGVLFGRARVSFTRHCRRHPYGASPEVLDPSPTVTGTSRLNGDTSRGFRTSRPSRPSTGPINLIDRSVSRHDRFGRRFRRIEWPPEGHREGRSRPQPTMEAPAFNARISDDPGASPGLTQTVGSGPSSPVVTFGRHDSAAAVTEGTEQDQKPPVPNVETPGTVRADTDADTEIVHFEDSETTGTKNTGSAPPHVFTRAATMPASPDRIDSQKTTLHKTSSVQVTRRETLRRAGSARGASVSLKSTLMPSDTKARPRRADTARPGASVSLKSDWQATPRDATPFLRPDALSHQTVNQSQQPVVGSTRPSTATGERGRGKSTSKHPWNDPPPNAPNSVRPFFEHLAPSRWRDKTLGVEKRQEQSERLHADALRRQRRKLECANLPIERTRWSGRLPGKRIDAGFDRIAAHAVAFVEHRNLISVPPLTQTGAMRYTGSHDEFFGVLQPCQVLTDVTRNAKLMKHHYTETAKRSVHKAERYEHYLPNFRPLSSRERELLKLDDVPSVPLDGELHEIAVAEQYASAEANTVAKQKLRKERSQSAAASRSYKASRVESETGKTAAMYLRLKSARVERAVLEAKTVEQREARANIEHEKRDALRKLAMEQQIAMQAKFHQLALARRAEVLAGDLKRETLERERLLAKRREMKALFEKQKAREAKYAEMMSAENDAGSALVLEVRRHRRDVDAAKKEDRDRRLVAKKQERKATREKVESYAASVGEMEKRQNAKQEQRKKELRERAAVLVTAAKLRRETNDAARCAERHKRGETTPPKKKKKSMRKSNETADADDVENARDSENAENKTPLENEQPAPPTKA